jgi:hypothetical protein
LDPHTLTELAVISSGNGEINFRGIVCESANKADVMQDSVAASALTMLKIMFYCHNINMI